MRGHADVAELLEEKLGDAVVEDAFAFDAIVLLVVEGGSVVLEMLDERSGLRTFVQDLGFAFVHAPAAVHVTFLSLRSAFLVTNAKKRGESFAQAARKMLSPS